MSKPLPTSTHPASPDPMVQALEETAEPVPIQTKSIMAMNSAMSCFMVQSSVAKESFMVGEKKYSEKETMDGCVNKKNKRC